jgi:MFS family permease
MFLWMTVVAVLSAGVGGLLQLGSGWRAHGPEVFLVLLIAAPLGLMIVLSLIDGLRKRPTRPRRPSQPAPKGPHEEGPDET